MGLLASEPGTGVLAFGQHNQLWLADSRKQKPIASAVVAADSASFCGPDKLITVERNRNGTQVDLSLWHRDGSRLERAVTRQLVGASMYGPSSMAVFPSRGEVALITMGAGEQGSALRSLDVATFADIAPPRPVLSSRAFIAASPDGRGYAYHDGGGDHVVQASADNYPVRVGTLAGKSLSQLRPADMITVHAALSAPDPYPGARPFLELLAACLQARFGAEITLGGHRPQAAAGDDITLGGAGHGS